MKRCKDSLFNKSKKANAVIDTVTVIVALFVFAFFTYILYPVSNDLNTDIQNDPDMPATSKQVMSDANTNYSNSMDGAFIFFLVLFWLFAIIASFQIDSHPIFFISSVLLLFIVFGVGAELSNSFTEFANEDDYLVSKTAMPMTFFVMDNLLLFAIFIGTSILIALYGRTQV